MSRPMPWDKDGQRHSAATPAAPATPTNPAPIAPQPVLPVGDLASVVASLEAQAQAALASQAGDQAKAWAQNYLVALIQNEPLPALPTSLEDASVTLPDGESFELADARSRAVRTFFQGLSIDAVAAIAGISGDLMHIDYLHTAGWTTFGILVGKTLLQTAISYISRVKITPAYQQQALGLNKA